MACPFFMPTRKLSGGAWPHPSRLPLGAGWEGHCNAPGHEGAEPSHDELTEFCNLGYATACSRLPQQRPYDAVRFSVVRDGAQLRMCFVCEVEHRPAQHGELQYDAVAGQWTLPHPDARIQKMAECYLESYLLRRMPSAPADSLSSLNS